MSLYDDVTTHIENPLVGALTIEEQLEPTKGAGAVICPPTYSGQVRGVPTFATSEGAPIPARSTDGWFHAMSMTNGVPRRGLRVVVNSLGACADQAETGIAVNQERLDVTLPGFVVDAGLVGSQRIDAAIARTKTKTKFDETVKAQIQEALRFKLTSWQLAHRTADSWIMFGQEPDSDTQVWAGDGRVKRILLNISHEAGDIVYGHAPNAAIYGSWLSSGTARRHAIPRAYSCEITGFGATGVVRGTTKLDPTGGTTKSGRKLKPSGSGLVLAEKGNEPSKLGFGQVPTQIATRGFQCELILRQASLSLRALSSFSYSDDASRAKAVAASRVYTLLAVAGHLLAQEDGFLRSECDLVTVEQRWGWRSHGVRDIEPMNVPGIDEVRDALHRALFSAEKVGLKFEPPITLTLSDAQIGLVVDRVLAESMATAEADV